MYISPAGILQISVCIVLDGLSQLCLDARRYLVDQANAKFDLNSERIAAFQQLVETVLLPNADNAAAAAPEANEPDGAEAATGGEAGPKVGNRRQSQLFTTAFKRAAVKYFAAIVPVMAVLRAVMADLRAVMAVLRAYQLCSQYDASDLGCKMLTIAALLLRYAGQPRRAPARRQSRS